MAPNHATEAVYRLLRDMMDTPEVPFGGKVIVFGGDFRDFACRRWRKCR
jgi:hypothetical protein